MPAYSARYRLNFSAVIWLGIALTAVLLSCAGNRSANRPSSSRVYYNHYHTYAFGRSDVVDSDNPIFSRPLLANRIKKELEFFLPTIGLDYSGRGPDLLIFFYVVADSAAKKPLLRYHIGWKAEPFITNGETFGRYPPNTLVIDAVDPRLNELVWRGSHYLPLENNDQTYRVLSKTVETLIRRYPGLTPMNRDN